MALQAFADIQRQGTDERLQKVRAIRTKDDTARYPANIFVAFRDYVLLGFGVSRYDMKTPPCTNISLER